MTPTFLLSSRLGLLHQPQGQNEPNLGVEDGPGAIITNQLADELHLQTHKFRYSSPDEVAVSDYYPAFVRETTMFRDRMIGALGASAQHCPTSIAVGGDHSVSLAHVAALLSSVAIPDRTGIIMLDSHADINLVKTSGSGNVHGMWLRPVISDFDVRTIDDIVPHKISPSNLVYVGNQNLDPGEREFIERQGIKVFSVQYVRENNNDVQHWFETWMKTLSHIHLSIDIDGFDQSLAPATGIPCLDGLFIADVTELLIRVKQQTQWSVDVVEVNPKKSGGQKTVMFAQKLIRTLLTPA